MSADRRHLYHELQKPGTTPEDDERRRRASTELEASNPLLAMPAEEFLGLLQLIVQSHRLVSARPRTKTHIQFAHGLLVLEGRSMGQPTGFAEESVWDWEALAQLSVDPLIAFAYRRMVRDVAALCAGVPA